MNKVEATEILTFLRINDLAQEIYTKSIVEDTLLEDNKELIFRGDDDTLIFEFIKENIEVISIEKFILLGVYMFNGFYRSTSYDNISKLINKTLHSKYMDLAKKYIPRDSDVMFLDTESGPTDKFDIIPVTAVNQVYGKKFIGPKFKLEKYFPEMVRVLDIEELDKIFDEENNRDFIPQLIRATVLGNAVMDLTGVKRKIKNLNEVEKNIRDSVEFNVKMRNELLKYLSLPEIKTGIVEDKLYINSAYEYLYHFETLSRYNVESNNNKYIIDIESLKKVKEMLDAIQDYAEKNGINMLVQTLNPSTNEYEPTIFSVEKFKKDCKEVFNDYIKCIIKIDESRYFDTEYISLLSKDVAIDLANSLNENKKSEYYYTLYKTGFINYQEMLEYEKNNNSNSRIYTIRAILDKFNEKSKSNIEYDKNSNDYNTYLSKITSPEIMFSIPITDKSIYDLLDENLKNIYLKASMNQYLTDGKYSGNALNNLKTLLKNGDIDNNFIKTSIIKNDNIEKIENLIGKEKIKELFDLDKLVINFVKQIEEDLADDMEHNLQRKLYNYYGYINNSKIENELLNKLDLLAFEPKVLEKLYIDGFISSQTVDELDSEVLKGLYERDCLKIEDKKYYIQNYDVDIKIGDLIRLNQDGILSDEDVFNLYMKNKISLNDFKVYAEEIDISNLLNETALLNSTRVFSTIKKPEIIEKFKKFSEAYLEIVGNSEGDSTNKILPKELQEKLFKTIGEKNARDEDIIYLYSLGLIEFKNLDASRVKDSVLISLIKEGKLKSEDEEYLFRDTEETGTKYHRLEKILPELNNSQRINLLASVYKTKEGETDKIAETRSNELLKYLDDAIIEKNGKVVSKNKKAKDENSSENDINNNNYGNTNTTRARISTLGNLFSLFKEIRPNYEHVIASGTYIVNLGKYVIVEQVYRTSNAVQNKSGEHAIYILSEKVKEQLTAKKDISLYEAVLNNLLETNRIGENYFDWKFLTEMKRKNELGIDKCLHTENFIKNIKKKMKIKPTIDKNEQRKCIDDIIPAGEKELIVEEQEI